MDSKWVQTGFIFHSSLKILTSSHRQKPERLRRIRLPFLTIPGIRKYLALRQLKTVFPLTALHRHAYLVAKSGSGKSELLKLLLLRLKQKLWAWPWETPVNRRNTVILLDPHGETADQCARQRLFFRDRDWSTRNGCESNLVSISPNAVENIFPNLNPFDLRGRNYTTDDLEIMAQALTRAFASMLGKGQKDLSLNMKTVLFPMFHVLLALSRKHPSEPMTFFDLARFLDDDRNEDLVGFGKREHQNLGQNLFFQTLFHHPQFASTKFSLKTKLASLLNMPMFVRLLCQKRSTWDLASLFGSGKTIIINASKSVLGSEVTEIYGRTITALLQGYALLFGGKTQNPTFFILDEAANFVSDDLNTILAELRKFGLHLTLVNQVIRQGGAGKELHDGIMGNTGLKIIGNAGAATRKAMATECEIPLEAFDNFRVGEFVIAADGRLPLRTRLPKFWLGEKTTVPIPMKSHEGAAEIHKQTVTNKQKTNSGRFRPRYGRARPWQ